MSGMTISEELYKYDMKIKAYETSFKKSATISEENKKTVELFLDK